VSMVEDLLRTHPSEVISAPIGAPGALVGSSSVTVATCYNLPDAD
jgi:hypothetical protein